MANNAINVNPISFPYNFGPLTPPALPGKGLYEVGTDQLFALGTKCETWDGRVFRYAKSGSAVIASEACWFGDVGYTGTVNFAVTAAIGDTEVTVGATTHDALAKDELRGGFISIFTNAVADNADNQFRGIIGNDAADASAAFKVYLDGPLTSALTTSAPSYCETFQNPYANLYHSTGDTAKPKAGVPAAYVSASGKYFWVQTRGPVFINPQSTVLAAQGMGCMWYADGSLLDVKTTLTGTTVTGSAGTQYAGHRIMGDYAGKGPLFMLQGN